MLVEEPAATAPAGEVMDVRGRPPTGIEAPSGIEVAPGDGVVTKRSPYTVPETVTRLTRNVTGSGLLLFGVFDQAAEARRRGLELRDTVLVLFGDPVAGTPIMAASPLSGLDLPLKVLVWADGSQTRLSYLSPSALVARYALSPALVAPLAGIEVLTDRVVAGALPDGTSPR